MKTNLTLRKLFRIVATGLGCTLVILSMAMPVAANGGGVPIVDGLYTGDEANYTVLGSADGGRGTLYYNRVGNTLYLLVRVDPSVNDNVFGDPADDMQYLIDVDWESSGNEHWWKALHNSDNMDLTLKCGTALDEAWTHDYLYDGGTEAGEPDSDPTEKDWLSGPDGPDGGGDPPPGLISASSLEWNMNQLSGWDITLGGDRTSNKTYKSPFDTDQPNQVPASYPNFDTTHQWEWAMVYEMSIDVSACGTNDIIISVPSAHNSPVKSGDEDVPICPDGCPLTGSIGDYVWHDVNMNGLQDDGEVGVPGVTVNLYKSDDTPVGPTTTNSDGLYTFTNLAPGDYYVEFVLPNNDDYSFTLQDRGSNDAVDSDADPTNGKTGTITLGSGATDLTWDAGLHLCDIGDRVWHDEDGDGFQTDPVFPFDDDEGFNGVDVYLYLYSSSPPTCGATGYVTMTTTISGTSQTPDGFPDGIYFFDMDEPGLGLGEYWVCVDESTLPDPDLGMQWAATTDNPQKVTYLGLDDFTFDFGYEQEGVVPTAVTLSSFAAKSSAGGSASPVWLGLAGLTILAAGSLFWKKRRTS